MVSNLKNSIEWHRKIINSYWVVVFLSILATITNAPFTSKSFEYYFYNLILQPGVILITIMFVTEIINKKLKKNHDYLFIMTAVILALVQIINHIGVFDFILSLLVFPIFISTYTFQKRKIMLSFLCCLISLFLIVYWTTYLENIYIDFISISTIVFMLLAGTYLSICITNRGQEILIELEEAMFIKQDLLVRNVLMEKASKMDLMTDLYNHATFYLHLEGLMEQIKKNTFPLQLAILDIDDFKSVNDQYGHKSGDEVIKKIAQSINDEIKSNDFAARYGGEEFAIIFVEKSLNESVEILERIRTGISEMSFTEMNSKKVTVSIGISDYIPLDTKESLFKRADEYLYRAKSGGKDTIITDLNSIQGVTLNI